jgi:cation:H+ antiporter
VILAAVAAIVGLVVMVRGADQFVLGAARIAVSSRVSPVVVGALILGFGTSLPELFVSALAAGGGDIDLAVGNITGSNIANLTLVLGVAGALTSVKIASGTIRRELPMAAGATALFGLAVWQGLSLPWGLVLLAVFAVMLTLLLRGSRDASEVELGAQVAEFVDGDAHPPIARELGRVLGGLAATLVGAYLLKEAALAVADEFGLSQGFVGLTLVAIGTSLPELVTAIAGARRGEDELVVGDLLGSNIFNSVAIGGVVALIAGEGLADPRLADRSILLMLAAVVLAAVVMGRRLEVGRWEAVALLVFYAAAVPLLA